MRHVLSFDVEEYFQVEAFHRAIGRAEWDRRPSRLGLVMTALLDLLDDVDVRATFFVLGWVAKRQPALVREIAARGHEVASHGYSHCMATMMTPQEFARDVRDARRLLSEIAGIDVLGYRAPTFSVVPRNAWTFDVLQAEGYAYDSSVFPIRHDRYGWPDFPRSPVRIVWPDGAVLDEYPMPTLRTPLGPFPVGGGGYFRALPGPAFRWAWRRLTRASHPSVFYLHPWELDTAQPRVPLGTLGRWRHYVGLSKTAERLSRMLREFRWTSFRDLRSAGAAPEKYLSRESLGPTIPTAQRACDI